MDKIKVHSGTKQKLETVFDNLQTHIAGNITKRINGLSTTRGILTDAIDINSANALKLASASTSTLTLQPGNVYFPNGEMLTIAGVQNITTSFLTSSTAGYHYILVKLKYNSVGSEPITVMTGFNYNTISGEYQQYAKYSDSYTITYQDILATNFNINTIINAIQADEVVLGLLKTDDDSETFYTDSWTLGTYTATAGVVDLRNLNTFKLSKSIYSEYDVILKDRSSVGNNGLNGSLNISGYLAAANYLYSPQLIINNGTGYNLAMYSEAGVANVGFQCGGYDFPINYMNTAGTKFMQIDIANNQLYINTDSAKITNTHTVNISGSLNVTGEIRSQGYLVKTAADEIGNNITNFQITTKKGNYQRMYESLSNSTRQLFSVNINDFSKLYTTFVWGKSNITGTSKTGSTFEMITADTDNWTIDYWKGLYLYVPSIPINLQIVSNDGTEISNGNKITRLYVVKEDNVGWSDINNTYNNCSIHANAEDYNILLTKCKSADDAKALEGFDPITFVAHSTSNTEKTLTYTGGVDAGYYYTAKIKGSKGGFRTDWFSMNNGNPVYIYPEYLTTSGISLIGTTTGAGFDLTIKGDSWNMADCYEFAYSTSTEGASFDPDTAADVTIKTSYEKKISITSNVMGMFHCVARPIIAKCSVCNPQDYVQTQVLAGAGGKMPNIEILYEATVDFRTFKGILTHVADNVWSVSSLMSPAESSDPCKKFPTVESIGTRVLTVDGYDYNIDDINSFLSTNQNGLDFITTESTVLKLTPIMNAQNIMAPELLTSTTHIFTIGVSKKSRILKTLNLGKNVIVTKLAFDCETLVGEDVTLRVYQEGRDTQDNDYDSLTIDSVLKREQECDVVIDESYGNMIMGIDLWDPATTTPKNNGSVHGELVVYGYATGQKANVYVVPTVTAGVQTLST